MHYYTISEEQLLEWRKDIEQIAELKARLASYFDERVRLSVELDKQEAKLAESVQDAHREARELDRANKKLAEVMPLAKFAAFTIARMHTSHKKDRLDAGISIEVDSEVIFAPNIEATIEKILKDDCK
jgi:regulator of replication initiation timing